MSSQTLNIDLRSDTLTQPTQAMREAMFRAEVGDDVYDEDPTVTELQNHVAALLNKEAALFAPSGTQSNLLALFVHCERGDEYIVGDSAHTFKYEGGGAAVLGSIVPQTIPMEMDGTLGLEEIDAAIKPDDFHFARTRLICLENTHAGVPLPLGYAEAVQALSERRGLAMHLDGARLFNAAIAQSRSLEALTAPFDTVSVCLSKGLGAPVGSVLAGPKPLIEDACRWRKVLGRRNASSRYYRRRGPACAPASPSGFRAGSLSRRAIGRVPCGQFWRQRSSLCHKYGAPQSAVRYLRCPSRSSI